MRAKDIDDRLSYLRSGEGKVIVLLPGWAKVKADYLELASLLAKKFTVYALDLPGFGETGLPRSFNLDDYADWLAAFLRKENIKKPILLGHSFGGRVAIKLAVSSPQLVDKLVLVDSGGIERKTARVRILLRLSGLGPTRFKKLLRPMVGSKDYLESMGLVRETMKKVVAENLEFLLPKIEIPTLIIWGKDDNTTPLWQGELMHRLIAGSRMEIVDGDHGLPYRKPTEVARIILEFLQ